MSRFVIVVCLLVSVGCSPAPPSDAPEQGAPRTGALPVAQPGSAPRQGGARQDAGADIEDGEGGPEAERAKCREFFAALGQVQSAEEEARVLTEFAAWLRENDYKIRVELEDGQHALSCPYFPPVTPWTKHTFHDAENLELLPRLP